MQVVCAKEGKAEVPLCMVPVSPPTYCLCHQRVCNHAMLRKSLPSPVHGSSEMIEAANKPPTTRERGMYREMNRRKEEET